jgi:hypothetical protein
MVPTAQPSGPRAAENLAERVARSRRHLYRMRSNNFPTAVGGLATLTFLAMSIANPHTRIVLLVSVPVLALYTWRGAIAGIRVEDAGIVVNQMLWSKRVPWSEVKDSAVQPVGNYPYVACARLTNGGELPT